jgi:proteic killer suppression protein
VIITKVFIVRKAEKDLHKLPFYILEKLYCWIEQVELYGIQEVRKIPGHHDEPLKGSRRGQRSIRLSKSYRAIYQEYQSSLVIEIFINEVHKHEY